MNHHHPVSEGATLARAAKHLIQNHGARAASVAAKRAAFLEECGEIVGADTWRKIGVLVHTIQTKGEHALASRVRPFVASEPRAESPSGQIAGPKSSAIPQEWPRRRETPTAPAAG